MIESGVSTPAAYPAGAADPAALPRPTGCPQASGSTAALSTGSALAGHIPDVVAEDQDMRTPTPWLLPNQPITTAGLLASGISKDMLATQLRTGSLVRPRQGVYLARSAWPEDPSDQRLVVARAELAANPDAVLSHQSAALAWGLPAPVRPWSEHPVSVTLPAGAGFRSTNGRAVHHVADLPPDDITCDADGYPITTLARTGVDLAAGLPLPDALVILDAVARSLCAGFVTVPRRSDYANPKLVEAARAALARVAQQRRRTGLARAIELTEPCRESPAESLSAGQFELAGLPRPRFQAAVRTPQGIFFPDCLWPDQRLVGECDGAVKYTDANAYVLEKEREQILRDVGLGVVRWLAKEIMARPSEVVLRVQRALDASATW